MSTSPDTQKRNNFTNQPPNALRSGRRSSKPGWILLKGILWLALSVGVLVGLVMYYDIVWDVLVGTVFPALETLFEVAEGALDSFFLLIGMSAAFAPMATAYFGFVLILAVVYLLSRKGIKTYKKVQAKKQEVSQTYASAWNEWYGTLNDKAKIMKDNAMERGSVWWGSLDLYNKVVAVIFMVLIGIPVLLVLSLILGNLVASLI
ncbi:MAG: hypothetical protein NTX45_09830 [Proteobacteria bacterium]|nr:hypothetical protein [Pseudomonadota bacterium]